MKTKFVSLVLSVVALVPFARADNTVVRSATNGALVGAVAGAVVGNNSRSLHNNGAKGAAIGAGAGLIVGTIIGQQRVIQRQEPVHYGHGGARTIIVTQPARGYRPPFVGPSQYEIAEARREAEAAQCAYEIARQEYERTNRRLNDLIAAKQYAESAESLR